MNAAVMDDIGIAAALPEESAIPDDDAEDESESDQQNGEPPEKDEDPFKKTYVSIDGIEEHDVSDEDKERLQRRIIEFMLHNGYPISGVRIISEDKNVIELDKTE